MNDTESSPDRPTADQESPAAIRGWLLIPLVLALLAFVILKQKNPGSIHGQDSPAVGKAAPQVDLVRLSDELELTPMRSVPADRVTLLHCWGTWCGPCRMEYPELSTMAGEMEPSQFCFLSVSCEGGAETFESLWAKTRDYLQGEGLAGKVYADPNGVTRRSLAERMQRESLFYPTSVLIDAQGTIAGVWEGYSPESVAQIKTRAKQLMASE